MRYVFLFSGFIFVMVCFCFASRLEAQQIYPNQANEVTANSANSLRLVAYRNLVDAREVLWSPGNLRLAVSANNQVFIFNTSNLGEEPVVISHTSPILDMAFNPDGSLLAVVSENELRIWRAIDANLYRQPTTTISANDIAYSNDGSLIAFSDLDDGGLKLWNTLTQEIMILSERIDGAAFINVDFNSDSSVLAGITDQLDIVTYSLQSGSLIRHTDLDNAISENYEIWHDIFQLRNDQYAIITGYTDFQQQIVGAVLIFGGAGSVDLIVESETSFISLTYDGTFAIGANGNDIIIAPNRSISYRLSHPDVSAAIFSNDGTQLISVGGGQIRLWRTQNDSFTRTQLGLFSEQFVDISCTNDNEPSIRSSLNTSASWSWFASTQDLLDTHIFNAQYDIQFDGNPVEAWVFLSAPEQNGDDWVVYYYMPVGTLPWGRHGFLYDLTWRNTISDGYEDYGPNTDHESEAGRCVFTISQN